MLQADGKLSTCDPKLASQGGFADGKPDVDPETGFFITDPVDHETRNATGKALNALGKINFAASPQQQGQLAVQLGAAARALAEPVRSRRDRDHQQEPHDRCSAKWTSKLADDKTEIEALLGVHRDGYANTAIDGTKNSVPLQVLINGSLGTWGPGFGETATTNEKRFDGIPNSADPYPFIINCPMNTRARYVGRTGLALPRTPNSASPVASA
ncbi:MAG: hypothetical protein IPQ07_44230 [Myxococcales bacterium]|nr:hypothetical protein [Myxococcales bacterium]